MRLIKLTIYLAIALPVVISSCRQKPPVKSPENLTRDKIYNLLIAMEHLLEMRNIQGYSDHESYCRTVRSEELAKDIMSEGYTFEYDDLLDGWKNPFQINFDESSMILEVTSSGEDGKFETGDDSTKSKKLDMTLYTKDHGRGEGGKK